MKWLNKLFLALLSFTVIQDLYSQNEFHIYEEAFAIILSSNCISNKPDSGKNQFIYFVSSQVLELQNADQIDTTNRTFFCNEKFYPKSKVFYIDEKLYSLNTINEDDFYDTLKNKLVVFFTVIQNNFVIAEVYSYNYFPVIKLKQDADLRADILSHRTYEYLKDFTLNSKFLFYISNGNVERYWCN